MTARLNLPDVTLCAVSDIAISQTIRALHRSMAGIRFSRTLMFSSKDLGPLEGIELIATTSIASRSDYSQQILEELPTHVTTSHVLIVQWDGYVLNPETWSNEFLEYDYVGAPWVQFSDAHNVGNGGFSLRSKRLLDACARLENRGKQAEDIFICRTQRDRLESEFGLRFAPLEVARRFSYERERPTGGEFGFHGVFNMLDTMHVTELLALLREVEPGLLRPQDYRDLLRTGLSRLNPFR